MQLDGKVALVTGASRGIGKSIALMLASRGADIVINYAGNTEAAEKTKAEVEALGRKAMVIKADVGDTAACEAMVAEVVKEMGKIDILVNNAGITRDGLLMRMKEADWDAVLTTNLKSVYNCTKAVIKYMMKARSGRIVSISSVVGAMGNAGQANYAAAKAGIMGFTKAVAKEVASRGITVNAVAPGFIATDMTAVLPEKVVESLKAAIPMGRLGAPEDIAKAVAFLVSEDAAYITGQTLHVNGGMFMY
ncbi:MAG: 3-oxoacyl-ACP reductase FabG [Succiniclasticum sp.]|jgi:3-oxoacyl-[acyl-carrier protein] reductase|nr:3-oxoacyl-ACP reductase FabG [Succiniclasticum sp.]MEE3479734.1 3-oxoacyl-ACP reductase FabG [Succiniclasticum sp.]